MVTEPEPEVPENLADAEHLAQQAAEDNDRQCYEEQVDPDGLSFWLLSPECACEKKSTRHIGRCDPEDSELQMPRTQQVGRKDRRQIEAIKRAWLGPVVGGCPSHQHLGEKEECHHDKVFYRRLLTLGGSTRDHNRMDVLRLALPAQVVEPAEEKENERRSPEEGDEAERAPYKSVARWSIPGEGIIREIVRIRIGLTRAVGDRGPCRPCEEGGELPQLHRISYLFVHQAPIR